MKGKVLVGLLEIITISTQCRVKNHPSLINIFTIPLGRKVVSLILPMLTLYLPLPHKNFQIPQSYLSKQDRKEMVI